MIYRHKLSNRQFVLIERQGRFGLFTEHGESGCAKIPMEMLVPAFDENTLDHIVRR